MSSELPAESTPFSTVAMVEILLGQDLVREAAMVVDRLGREYPDDPRLSGLRARLSARQGQGETIQIPREPLNTDTVSLEFTENILRIDWELSDEGLALAKRRVRYSGESIVRLFTAAVGPRGVRKVVRDIPIQHQCAGIDLAGTPGEATHVAAIGYLGRNGAFVPLSRSIPKASTS